MALSLLLIVLVAVSMALAMARAKPWQWALSLGAVTLAWQCGLFHGGPHLPHTGFFGFLIWLALAALGSLSIDGVRRRALVQPVFKKMRAVLPRISDTEQQALDAGTVGFDAEIFSGTPDWGKLRGLSPAGLTEEERAFLDGPTDELCRMIDHWRIRHVERRMPKEVWDFVKAKGFLGMLISKEHGGLGFSAAAQSLILGKIASRSPDVVTIVMVPNSLGPGELIERYGTEAQKAHFLPRLAQGLDVPCFALTGPNSGSDAAAMRDVGYVTKGEHEGRETVGIRLSWDKRYITLGPDATLLGLAFRLFDPDKILGEAEDIGITVALIPTDYPGVKIGRRHLPSGAAFPNGPTSGRDVFIPIDWVIGGQERVGQGWRMLMECLAAGRAISLPSSATAGAKAMLRFTSAYARIRRQFGLPIGRMEGVEEPLARLVENAYVNEAARAVTAAMVSRGERPSVLSALMKYQTTERLRGSVNDAFDIHGGRAICDGPSNYLQAAYQLVPVGITVEGANILTRTLITFAQGALRAHPYLYREVQAVRDPDSAAGLAAFDEALCGHAAFSASNIAGAFFHNLTLGRFAGAPKDTQGLAPVYRQLSRAARNFALISDLTVALLGGGLKVKQKLTGRLADALSEIFLTACVLKRFEDDGSPEADRPIVAFAAANGLHRFEEALRGTIENFPNAFLRPVLRVLVFPYGRHYYPAPDALASRVVRPVLAPGEVRDRLTRDMFVSDDPDDPTGLLELAFRKVVAVEEAEKKLERAIRTGIVRRYHGRDWIAEAADAGSITESEAALLREAEVLTQRAIAVDHFAPDELMPHYGRASAPSTARGLRDHAGANPS